ncbi:uncharacterized protein MONBRDRAFT_14574 [Monosiga brevicollis MX1]|uniref:Kinesin-like protein n=1 Tax=Monosiga brevicollis TaxID=81824 RepID=A9URQ7_MONBE|nr:uncharacterized protein MONBRDRAFT_14574 [Monosiga brevicollis MX1]EDQ91648.1 predicted protein [Monosiga brevicollis MX1]|eukprot:XP_001742934.1 hypothetical protein [Monosiga brevicollis MX1]
MTEAKRKASDKADILEVELEGLKEDHAALEQEFKDRVEQLQKEIADLNLRIDPVKLAQAQAASGATSALDNEEIDNLRREAAELRERLRDAQDQNRQAASSSQVPAAAAAAFERKIKDLQSKNEALEQQLRTAKAEATRLAAASAGGAERDAVQAELNSELQAQVTEWQGKAREAETARDALSTKLEETEAQGSRLQKELSALKQSMDEQSAALASASGSADDIKTQLSTARAELAQTKANLQSEQESHVGAKKNLQEARAEIASLKESASKQSDEATSTLRQEREKHAATVQELQAAKAAAVAEAESKAEERMQDMTSRLGNMTKQLAPMKEALTIVAAKYKELRKDTLKLQGEIEPSVKQCKRDLLRTLADIDKQYKEMLRKYRKEMQLRKKLHNELVDLKGNIRVFARIRPIIGEDGKDKAKIKLVTLPSPADDQIVQCNRKGKAEDYEMDHVFSPTSTQEEVFERARDVIVSCIDGYNVCIFAYGQTGSGKTFTMDGPDDNPGLNRRALAHLFEVTAERSADWTYEIEISVLEIYNETINDLLADKRPKGGLAIRHGKDGPQVPDLSRHPVTSAEEVRSFFMSSQKNRKTFATDMNEHSSRSHALLIVYVNGTNLSTGVSTLGKLNLIDLAGSERPEKSGAINDPERLKEATKINQSLSCLGDVINALGTKQKHVPYRNSKLTHLLQDSLGGSAKTVMVVQISPVEKNVDETSNSLKFASRVRAVELGSAKKTKESAEMAALKKRIRELESS